MSKIHTPAMRAHLDEETTRLAAIWRITRKDGAHPRTGRARDVERAVFAAISAEPAGDHRFDTAGCRITAERLDRRVSLSRLSQQHYARSADEVFRYLASAGLHTMMSPPFGLRVAPT
jgi:hypothetical protein